MKSLLIASALFLSAFAHARGVLECYSFPTGKSADGIPVIQLRLENMKKATITANRTPARGTITDFTCNDATGILSCVEKTGLGGDFTFKKVNGRPTIEFIYLNLQIGSHGSVAFKRGEEIGDEFSLYDRAGDEDSDSEDANGEMTSRVSLSGSRVSCP